MSRPVFRLFAGDFLFILPSIAPKRRKAEPKLCLFTLRKGQALSEERDFGLLCAPFGHTGRPRRVFWHAHVAPENRLNLISPLRWRNSTRLLWAGLLCGIRLCKILQHQCCQLQHVVPLLQPQGQMGFFPGGEEEAAFVLGVGADLSHLLEVGLGHGKA